MTTISIKNIAPAFLVAITLPLSSYAANTTTTLPQTTSPQQSHAKADMFIGEIGRIQDIGYSTSQIKQMLPTGNHASDTTDYAVHMPTIKRLNGYDIIKTEYAVTKHVSGIRYTMLALVDPKTKEVVRASIRVVSSTGTGEFDTDQSVSTAVKKRSPTREFEMAVDAKGRVFKLTPSKNGAADYCNKSGDCRYERAYDMEITPSFVSIYAKGGSLALISKDRPVEIYIPENMMRSFYQGLKAVS